MAALVSLLEEVHAVDDLESPVLTEDPWTIELSAIRTAASIPAPPPLPSAREFLDSVCPRRTPSAAPPKRFKTDLDSLASGLDKFKTSGVFNEILRDDIEKFTRDRLTNLAMESGAPEILNRSEVSARLKDVLKNVRNSLAALNIEGRANLSIRTIGDIIDDNLGPRVEHLKDKMAKEVKTTPQDDPDLNGETNMRVHRERHALKSGLAEGGTIFYGNNPEGRLNARDLDDDPDNFEQLQSAVTDQGHAADSRTALAREAKRADEGFHNDNGRVPEDRGGVREVPNFKAPRPIDQQKRLKYDSKPDSAGRESRELGAPELTQSRVLQSRGPQPTGVNFAELVTPTQMKILETARELMFTENGTKDKPNWARVARALGMSPDNVRKQIQRMRERPELRNVWETIPNAENLAVTTRTQTINGGATIGEQLKHKGKKNSQAYRRALFFSKVFKAA